MGNIKTKIACLFTVLYFFSSTVVPAFANITYSYDANGNMTSDGVYCYTYNDANQVSQVKNCSNNQQIAQYVYDYQGNRIVKKNYVNGTLNNTVYSPNKGYETKKLSDNSTQNTTYYYVKDDLVAKKNSDGTKHYYLSDNLHSTSVLTNQSGTVVENTTYYPFGDIRSGGTKSKYLYTSQENDPETGLDYYNARYYYSHIRHFTQPDDIIADLYNPQQLNRYSYVGNNPLTYNDPTGHIFGIDDMLAIGAGAFILANAPVITTAANSLVHDVQNHNLGGAVDTASWFVPGISEEKVAVAGEAKVGTLVTKQILHGNDLRNTTTTIGYTLRDKAYPNIIKKFGETINAAKRYSQKWLTENNLFLKPEAIGTKKEMHFWQHEQILKYTKKHGVRPPLNKSNW